MDCMFRSDILSQVSSRNWYLVFKPLIATVSYAREGLQKLTPVPALALACAACAAAPSHYTAGFDRTYGLGPGDPVVHAGNTIGSVTAVQGVSSGTEVSIEVEHEHRKAVRNDSILILDGTGSSASLELMSPDPSSAYAPEGMQLYGASNQSQAQLLMSSLGPSTFVQSYAQFMGSNTTTPPPNAPPSILQQQLVDIMQRSVGAAAAASGTAPAGRAQVGQFQQDADAVERELDAHGQTAAAARLRSQAAQLNAASAAPGPPNSLTVPSPPTTP